MWSLLELEGLTVSAAREKGSVSAALDQQRTATGVVSAITTEQITRSPDSDAAQAVQRVSGVTVQDGKFVVVRGLGERYTTTSLNGARIPSPEPERRVVPLHLFPAGLLQTITTAKTFTPNLPGDFSALAGGAGTREALVRRWVAGVEGQDTAALREMVVSRAEFAWLYYPESPLSARGMRPEVLWLLMQQNSHKGIFRVLRRLGGQRLGYVGHDCPAEPLRQGESRVWEGCVLERQVMGDTVVQRLFGRIIGRDGHLKFVSYANGL
jgi:hypothetical protein